MNDDRPECKTSCVVLIDSTINVIGTFHNVVR